MNECLFLLQNINDSPSTTSWQLFSKKLSICLVGPWQVFSIAIQLTIIGQGIVFERDHKQLCVKNDNNNKEKEKQKKKEKKEKISATSAGLKQEAIDEFTRDKEKWDSFAVSGSRSQSREKNGFLVPNARNGHKCRST